MSRFDQQQNTTPETLLAVKVVEGDANNGVARTAWAAGMEGSVARTLLDRDARAFFHQSLSTPCLDAIIKAAGPFIINAAGRRILDFHGNSVHQVGHGHPEVIEAIERTVRALPFSPRRFTNEPAVRLAERLIELAPGELAGNARVLLVPSGAVAVGLAVRLARAVTGRHKTISFAGSFHGATLEAAWIGGQDLFTRGMGPLPPGALHVEPPCSQPCNLCDGLCTGRCADRVEALLAAGDVAAVVAEPVRATTVHVPPPAYWSRVREACTRHGTLLIFDEIPTGLGRSGRMWACEHFGVTPDILVIGKGLGGGIVPIAGIVGRAELNDAGVIRLANLSLGHFTHEKSPAGAAAALATLEILTRDALPARAAMLGSSWAQDLREALFDLADAASVASGLMVRGVRNLGLMVAVELGGPRARDIADRCLYEMLARGLSCKVGGGVNLVFFPPLNIERTQLERATSIIIESLMMTQRA
ncbi:MAG: aspartate aminotransferase family protein [Phycisphaerales bacterium]|nr:aspartate aminotransferase family protein [Phycisphaerales bacterium]